MKNLTLAGAVGISVMFTANALGVEHARSQNVWTTTATWNGKPTTITVGDYTYSSGHGIPTVPNYPMPEITAIAEHGEDDFTFTYTYDEQPVTESDTTWTEPAGTFVMTISDGHLVPQPPRAAETPTPVIDRAADVTTSFSMWIETTTYTQVIPATTITGSTFTNTFDAYTFTNTWTRIVTTHITIPDAPYPSPTGEARKTTLETVMKEARVTDNVDNVCSGQPWMCTATSAVGAPVSAKSVVGHQEPTGV